MSRAEVEAAIPHRDPFLLVDRVLDAGSGWLVGAWRVPPEAEWVRGHYPGRPVTPGVLLCEHAFQCGALFVARSTGGLDPADGVPVLTRIADARFRRMVRPGESVETRVDLEERLGSAWWLAATVARGGERVLRVRFALALAAEEEAA